MTENLGLQRSDKPASAGCEENALFNEVNWFFNSDANQFR